MNAFGPIVEMENKIEKLKDELAAANAEIQRLSGKTGYCAECEEQARLLGMSGSREAKLIAELATVKAEIETYKYSDYQTAKILGEVKEKFESENKRLRETIQRNEDKSVKCERLREALESILSDKHAGKAGKAHD
jgi:chromosome segregation ATPase